MSSERAYIQGLEKVRDELEARIKELEETLWVGYHCSPKCVCRGREKELEAENATLVDQHNRASHGTASHEALAYDAQERRIQELEEFIAERSGDASLVGRIKELEAVLNRQASNLSKAETRIEELEATDTGLTTLALAEVKAERNSMRVRIEELEAEKRVFFDMKGQVKAERDRYEEALRAIRDGKDYAPWSMEEDGRRIRRKEMQDIARQALGEEEG